MPYITPVPVMFGDDVVGPVFVDTKYYFKGSSTAAQTPSPTGGWTHTGSFLRRAGQWLKFSGSAFEGHSTNNPTGTANYKVLSFQIIVPLLGLGFPALKGETIGGQGPFVLSRLPARATGVFGNGTYFTARFITSGGGSIGTPYTFFDGSNRLQGGPWRTIDFGGWSLDNPDGGVGENCYLVFEIGHAQTASSVNSVAHEFAIGDPANPILPGATSYSSLPSTISAGSAHNDMLKMRPFIIPAQYIPRGL